MTSRTCRACGGSGKINRYKVIDGVTTVVEQDCGVCKKSGEVTETESEEEAEVINTTKWVLVVFLIFLTLFIGIRVVQSLFY